MEYKIPFTRKALSTAIQATLWVAGSLAIMPVAQAGIPGNANFTSTVTYDPAQVAAVTTTDASGNLVYTTTTGGPGGVGGVTPTNAYAPGSGLLHTPHNFLVWATTAIGLCTFCHTPHKASTTFLLWNHTLSQNSFNWNAAATTSGTKLPGFVGTSYNGPSAKCLSCHDGTVAIGDVGWFDDSTHTGGSGGAYLSTTKVSGNYLIAKSNGDLSGNHPVAIPYPYQDAPNTYNGSTTGAYLATDQFVADPTLHNIRLYSDIGGDAIVGRPTPGITGIECPSCHDPHNKAATGRLFLRGKIAGDSQASGYICLQCHIK